MKISIDIENENIQVAIMEDGGVGATAVVSADVALLTADALTSCAKVLQKHENNKKCNGYDGSDRCDTA